MASHGIESRVRLPRIEGGMAVYRNEEGRIRLHGSPSLGFEAMVLGKDGLDAAMRFQHISADGGIAHALTAMEAWENAGNLPVAENGRALRGILHAAAMLHAHLRHFYLQMLPDYLPEGTLSDYTGGHPSLNRMRSALAGKPRGYWTRHTFDHPFNLTEVNRLWEHKALALDALELLQRMMAVIGGRFPMVMSVVPGGVNLTLRAANILKLRGLLEALQNELADVALTDGILLVKRHPALAKLGEGSANLLSAGSGEDESVLDGGLFPSGILLAGKLEPFTAEATESIERAYYRVPDSSGGGGLAQPAPEKPNAYSWIKAPRYQGQALETGPIARIAIAYLSGARIWDPQLANRLASLTGRPIIRSNTVAGRILARLGEVGGLLSRIESLLDQLDPGQPTVASEQPNPEFSGEGAGYVEAPAGTLAHRMIVEKGRIVHADTVSPNTWNGAPEDQNGRSGPLVTALNRTEHDLVDPKNHRDLSRIVQSFAFSMRDAVH